MNSLPLSTLIVVGKPRYAAIRSSVLTTSSPLRLCPTSIARLSRVKLSTTVSARKRLPSNNASATKSMLQIWFMAVTSCFGWRNLADLFLLGRFRRSDSPSAWFSRLTRKRKTDQPTRKSNKHTTISVVHTCGCDLLDAHDERCCICLFFSSVAVVVLLCVDLGGRRIIKKKKSG